MGEPRWQAKKPLISHSPYFSQKNLLTSSTGLQGLELGGEGEGDPYHLVLCALCSETIPN